MVQMIKNYLKERNTKKQILSQISDECKSSEIFDLFFQIKSKSNLQNTEDPVLKIFKLKNQFVLQKINELKKNNETKKDVVSKSFKLLEEKFQYFKEVYQEFSKSEQHHFSFKEEIKIICFLKSEKKHSLLECFAFEVFYADIFVHAKREYTFKNMYSDCKISSKDKKLLKKLELLKQLDYQWEFDDDSKIIKSIPFKQINISWEKLKEIFFSLVVSNV